MMHFKSALLGTVLALTAIAGAAHATPITGQISITGLDSYDTTSVTFVQGTGVAYAAAETGSFTAIGNAFGPNVTLTSFAYAPMLTPSPVTIFSATGNGSTAAFSLSSITSYSYGANQLSINGVGTLSLTGFDSTMGNFMFSTQGGSNSVVTFSATSVAVPEPASMALLGAGLIGVGVLRRRRAK